MPAKEPAELSLPAGASARPLAHVAEDALTTVCIGALVVLPIAEVTLRAVGLSGISGVWTLVQHLTLWLSVMGAAVAARENRLLQLTTGTAIESLRLPFVGVLAGATTASVSALLAAGAYEFMALEREGNAVLFANIPVWWALTVLPAGFAWIALRGITGHSQDWRTRLLTVAVAAATVTLILLLDPASGGMWLGLALVVTAALAGTPLFAVLAGISLLLLHAEALPIASMALDHYRIATEPALPAIPLFTLAGFLLAYSESPRRIVNVFSVFFGRFRSAAVVVAVGVAIPVTSFTGASGVTILALGGLLMPVLRAAACPRQRALGIIAGGGSAGVLLAPSLPLILYAVVAEQPIDQMFLAGLLPAALFATLTLAWGSWQSDTRPLRDIPARWREKLHAVAAAKWELMVPVIAFGVLLGGLATPLETAAITAGYVLFVTCVVHREINVRTALPGILVECGTVVGSILLVLGVAFGLATYIVDIELPSRVIEWATGTFDAQWQFLLALNLLLLAAGCVMDIFSAIIVLAPILVPAGMAFGIHPVHMGIIFLANLELGYLTPPVGLNLFYAATRFEVPVTQVARSTVSLLAFLGVGLLAVTWLPVLSTWMLSD